MRVNRFTTRSMPRIPRGEKLERNPVGVDGADGIPF